MVLLFDSGYRHLVCGFGSDDAGLRHDYVMFGPTIASFDFPTLRLFFLTFRYSIPSLK